MESFRIMINIIDHTEELPIIGIGRRIKGVKKTSNNRHLGFNQLIIPSIFTKYTLGSTDVYEGIR